MANKSPGSIAAKSLKAQQEYASREYIAYITTSYFSGASRFRTKEGATDYLREQVRRMGRVGKDSDEYYRHVDSVDPRTTKIDGPYMTWNLEDLGIAVRPHGPGAPLWIIQP